VVVDDCLGAVAVSGLDLGEVLPDGDELDALPGGGGGEIVEVAEGCVVGGFVEDDEQRGVERTAGGMGSLVRRLTASSAAGRRTGAACA
jgi:hypothetical protein